MTKFNKLVKEYIPYILIIVIILLIKKFVFSPIIVNGDSMDSTLKDGDVMILNKFEYYKSDIERFDIVVIRHEKRYIIKRVIGLPGDKVKIVDNVLYINDKAYAEDYLDKETVTEDIEISEIKEGYYFVLGDNREVSLDSRSIGLIKESSIEGKATFTLFPFDRFGKKE